MAWFSDLAGKAENLLNNLDEQTGAALRNHNVLKTKKGDRSSFVSNDSAGQKKKPIQRGRKFPVATEIIPNSLSSRKSPTSIPINQAKDVAESKERIRKKSPARKPQAFNLNRCPKTMVGDIKDADSEDNGTKHRRYSLPTDLDSKNLTFKMQNLEVENAMLKNELNVLNSEVKDLCRRLRTTEDVLGEAQGMLEHSELETHKATSDKEVLANQLDQLKLKFNEVTSVDVPRYKEQSVILETEARMLKERNSLLEERVKELNEKLNEKHTAHIKIETELRYSQSMISDLQNDLECSTAECRRLERDWETYKLRVKSMLYTKDNEIKSLRDGLNVNEDTKALMDQLESLKSERGELSEAVTKVRNECGDMQQHIEKLESRHNAAERVVAALRDALREERAARNSSESQCVVVGKQLKAIQMETNQAIANLKTALREKEEEIRRLRETSSVRTADTSALNVADYDAMQDSIESDKIQYLTETLVQKQSKIDALIADNNMLRIQYDKLQSKYKVDITQVRNNAHVVHVQEGECRNRNRNTIAPANGLSKLSMKMGVVMKRYPIFRLFVVIYMIGLHLWVLTVLFTSTPENVLIRPTKL